jgi:hypothetical protein
MCWQRFGLKCPSSWGPLPLRSHEALLSFGVTNRVCLFVLLLGGGVKNRVSVDSLSDSERGTVTGTQLTTRQCHREFVTDSLSTAVTVVTWSGPGCSLYQADAVTVAGNAGAAALEPASEPASASEPETV